MKRIYFVLCIMGLFVFLSCQKDTETITISDYRSEIIKKWKCIENNGDRTYDVTISKDETGNDKISVFNFHGIGSSLKISATVSGTKITVPTQTVETYTFSGSATIADDASRIDWSYNVQEIGGQPASITATYTLTGSVKK